MYVNSQPPIHGKFLFFGDFLETNYKILKENYHFWTELVNFGTEANQAFFGTFLGHWSRPSPEIGTFSQPLKDLKLTMKLLIENTWDSSGEKRSEGLCR